MKYEHSFLSLRRTSILPVSAQKLFPCLRVEMTREFGGSACLISISYFKLVNRIIEKPLVTAGSTFGLSMPISTPLAP